MAHAGQGISNPVTGQRLVFVTTAKETSGEYFVLEWFVDPLRGKFPAEHVHHTQAERFEILDGMARYRLGGIERGAGPGDAIDFPPHVPHLHPWSASPETLHFKQITRSLQPDLRGLQLIEQVTETGFGLARAGKVDRAGNTNPFQTAVMAEAVFPGIHATRPPLIVQRMAVAILAPLGRLLGYRLQYPEYIDRSA